MPYVAKQRAAELSSGNAMHNAGDLAFVLSAEVERFFRNNEMSFASIAAVQGALHTTAMEFDRRVAIPYEQGKLDAGGADPFEPVVARVKNAAKRAARERLLAARAEADRLLRAEDAFFTPEQLAGLTGTAHTWRDGSN